MAFERSLTYKVYNESGTYLGLLNNFIIGDSFSIEKKINGGDGDFEIMLDKKVDDFNEGSLISFNNRIKVYLKDQYNTSGETLIAYGYIVSYSPTIEGKNEYVKVKCLSAVSKLSNEFYKSTTAALGSDLAVQLTSKRADEMFQDIVTNYRGVETNSMISNDFSNVSATTDNAGNSISFTHRFFNMKHLEAMFEAGKFLPKNKTDGYYFYWRIDTDGKLWVKQISTTANHTFIIGKHIERITGEKTIADVVNKVYFWNEKGQADPDYLELVAEDTTSQNSYDTISTYISDSKVTYTDAANLLAQSKLYDGKYPKVDINVDLNANYNLASIKPGHVCKILNLNNNPYILADSDPLLIVNRIIYKVDSATLELSNGWVSVEEFIENERRLIDKKMSWFGRITQEITGAQLAPGIKSFILDFDFSPSTDADKYRKVTWTAGALYIPAGYSSTVSKRVIAAGDTGNMTAGSSYYIYLDEDAKTTSSASSEESGTGGITSGGQSMLDATKSWTSDQWKGYVLYINGEKRTIKSNTATILNIEDHFSTLTSSTYAYNVYKWKLDVTNDPEAVAKGARIVLVSTRANTLTNSTALITPLRNGTPVVGGDMIAPYSITNSQLSPDISFGTSSATLSTDSIESYMVKDGAIIAGKIGTAAVTTDKIYGNAIRASQIYQASVRASHISENAVIAGKISYAAVQANNIAGNAIQSSHIGTAIIYGSQLRAGTITGGNIGSATIFGSNIGLGQITGENIFSATITGDKIREATISGANIKEATISANNIGGAAVKSSHISLLSVRSGHIDALAVIAGKIAGNAIYASNITSNAVTSDKIIANAVTSDKIISNAVTAEKISTAAIEARHLGSNVVYASNIQSLQITSDKIGENAVVAGKIAVNAVTANTIAANAVRASNIVNYTIKSNKIGTNSVYADSIQNYAVISRTIAGTAVRSSHIAARAVKGTNIAIGTITASNIGIQAIVGENIAIGTIMSSNIGTIIIDGDDIAVSSIRTYHIENLAVTGGKVAMGTISADKMKVTRLSAITADMGDITAGTITMDSSGYIRGGQDYFNHRSGYWIGLHSDSDIDQDNPLSKYSGYSAVTSASSTWIGQSFTPSQSRLKIRQFDWYLKSSSTGRVASSYVYRCASSGVPTGIVISYGSVTVNSVYDFVKSPVLFTTDLILKNPITLSSTYLNVTFTNSVKIPDYTYVGEYSGIIYNITDYPTTDGIISDPNAETVLIQNSLVNNWTVQKTGLESGFKSIALSDEGKYKICSIKGGKLYLSNDYGETWTQKMSDSNRNWTGVCMSCDGQKMAACVKSSYIYYSSDYGETWYKGSTSNSWASLVANDSFSRVYATLSSGGLFLSTNSGQSFSSLSTNSSLKHALACSKDGIVVVASAGRDKITDSTISSNIFVSTSSGARFTSRGSYDPWEDFACSSNGSTIYAVNSTDKKVFYSTNYGATFSSATVSSTNTPRTITINSDANKIYFCIQSQGLYYSDDGMASKTKLLSVSNTNSFYSARTDRHGSSLLISERNGSLYEKKYYNIVKVERADVPMTHSNSSKQYALNIPFCYYNTCSKYAATIKVTGTGTIHVAADTSSPTYYKGAGLSYNGTAWSSSSSIDYIFKTYINSDCYKQSIGNPNTDYFLFNGRNISYTRKTIYARKKSAAPILKDQIVSLNRIDDTVVPSAYWSGDANYYAYGIAARSVDRGKYVDVIIDGEVDGLDNVYTQGIAIVKNAFSESIIHNYVASGTTHATTTYRYTSAAQAVTITASEYLSSFWVRIDGYEHSTGFDSFLSVYDTTGKLVRQSSPYNMLSVSSFAGTTDIRYVFDPLYAETGTILTFMIKSRYTCKGAGDPARIKYWSDATYPYGGGYIMNDSWGIVDSADLSFGLKKYSSFSVNNMTTTNMIDQQDVPIGYCDGQKIYIDKKKTYEHMRGYSATFS